MSQTNSIPVFNLIVFGSVAVYLLTRFYPALIRAMGAWLGDWRSEAAAGLGGQEYPPDDLRHVLISFSDEDDQLTVGDLCTGVCVFGQNGSGKTTSTFFTLLSSMFHSGYGGLFLTTKVNDASEFMTLAEKCGRAGDVVRISADGPWRYNPLDVELNRSGAGGGLSFSIARLLATISEQQSKLKGGNSDPFWTESCRILQEHAITLCKVAYGRVWLEEVDRLIISAPTSPESLNDEQWKAESFFARTVLEVDLDVLGANVRQECESALEYFFDTFASLADNTRSSVIATHQSVASKFLSPPFRNLFFRETNFTPDDAFAGNKIVILDLPAREWGDAGLLCQGLVKMSWQQAIERRDLSQYGTPFILAIDECQNHINEYDRVFLATSRSVKCIPIYMTQNLPALIAAVGEEKARSTALAIAGLFGVKVFHSNSCSRTNEYAATTLSKRYMSIDTTGSSEGRVSVSEQLVEHYLVQPGQFAQLKPGGYQNGFVSEAWVFQAGRRWSNGENFTLVAFEQILV